MYTPGKRNCEQICCAATWHLRSIKQRTRCSCSYLVLLWDAGLTWWNEWRCYYYVSAISQILLVLPAFPSVHPYSRFAAALASLDQKLCRGVVAQHAMLSRTQRGQYWGKKWFKDIKEKEQGSALDSMP